MSPYRGPLDHRECAVIVGYSSTFSSGFPPLILLAVRKDVIGLRSAQSIVLRKAVYSIE